MEEKAHKRISYAKIIKKADEEVKQEWASTKFKDKNKYTENNVWLIIISVVYILFLIFIISKGSGLI